LSTRVSDERLNRALTAFLRQEVQAPAAAITDFLDIIIEDARRLHLDHLLADLDRMRTASARLNAFVKTLIQGASSDQNGQTIEAFHGQLRHDLQNPLNAIKGYSELLLEDMEGDDEHPLRGDLAKLKESADQLLDQIDTMVLLGRYQETGLDHDGGAARRLDIVADVLRAVEPLPASSAGQATVRSSRILVVDDNAANRDVLARRLTREGHQVVTAANGAFALELVAGQEFDLVLLDLIMPEMSGFELLRRLKATQHTSDVPVIVISALDELDSVVRCIEADAEDYLTKPFNPVLLRARIGASLEKKWLRDREKRFIEDLEQERRRSESLLLNILPQSIVNRLREGETIIADRISEATILFCDLVGFTALSRNLPPDRTIDLLTRIFSAFDRLCAEHGVEKIKTIGDAYMAAAGIPERQSDHAARIAMLAPRMLAAVEDIAKATDLKLQARVGIHTGPIVAGVLGTHKFVYDVWGDTVNTASRMESHSLPVAFRCPLPLAMRSGIDSPSSRAEQWRSRARGEWRPTSCPIPDRRQPKPMLRMRFHAGCQVNP
jgi:adenylate cyclase